MHVRVNTGWGRGAPGAEHSPQLSGARVAENRFGTAGQDGRHPSPGLAQASMPDRIYAAMNTVEATRLDSAKAAPFVDARCVKVASGDNAMLPGRDPGDSRVGTVFGEFPTHVGG